jgi:hypothetical protein
VSRFVKCIPLCTATLTPGAITQRVARVDEPSDELCAMMDTANRNLDHSRRRKIRKNHERDLGRGFCCVGISVYPDDLADLDEAVEKLKAAGRSDMSRSKLLRIAFKRLDLAKLAAERPE